MVVVVNFFIFFFLILFLLIEQNVKTLRSDGNDVDYHVLLHDNLDLMIDKHVVLKYLSLFYCCLSQCLLHCIITYVNACMTWRSR